MSRNQDRIDTARGIAVQFRLGMSVPAALTLVDFITAVCADIGRPPPALEAELGQLVGELLACQEAHDWLGLADSLEFELADWFARLDAAGATLSVPGA